MRKTTAAAYALFLLAGAQPSLAADDATLNFTKALNAACQPWMAGAERKALSKTLQADGWSETADVLFANSGAWGRITVALQQPSGETKPAGDNWLKQWTEKTYGTQAAPAAPPVKRTCQVMFNTNDDPWTTDPAATAIAAWVASTFPSAQKKNGGTLTIEGKPVDAMTWKDGKTTVTQVIHQSKQNPPDTDILLSVENE